MRPPGGLIHESRKKHAGVWPRAARLLLFVLVAFVDRPFSRAAEPFFQKGDVVAIVGGEDMVALSGYSYLELLLTRALPDYHLRFRNLAQEGDTVFEQRRGLGFPTWEEALEKIGATVVFVQFGQMESLAGAGRMGVPPSSGGVSPPPPEVSTAADAERRAGGSDRMSEPAGGTPTLPEFIAAYEQLLGRLRGGWKKAGGYASSPSSRPNSARSTPSPLSHDHAAELDKDDPAAELASFQLPPGFEVGLFASEKDGVVKPIQIGGDTRRRLRVIQSTNLPAVRPRRGAE